MFCAYLVFNACKNAELAFYNYAVSVSVFNNLLCESDVVLISMVRAVYHNGREAAVDARLADFKVCAVVKVECEVDTAVFDSSLSESYKVSLLSVLSCACGNLKDNGGSQFARSFRDSLDYFHIVDVESADGIVTFVSLLEHLCCSNKCHDKTPFNMII